MSTIANDLGRFDGDLQAFSAACKQFGRSFSMLKTNMNVLQGMWEGEACDALHKRFLEDYAKLESLMEYMRAMDCSLRNAKVTYSTCEYRVRSLVNSLNI